MPLHGASSHFQHGGIKQFQRRAVVLGQEGHDEVFYLVISLHVSKVVVKKPHYLSWKVNERQRNCSATCHFLSQTQKSSVWWQASSASLLSDGFVWFYVFTMETAEGQTVCAGWWREGRWGLGVKAVIPYKDLMWLLINALFALTHTFVLLDPLRHNAFPHPNPLDFRPSPKFYPLVGCLQVLYVY